MVNIPYMVPPESGGSGTQEDQRSSPDPFPLVRVNITTGEGSGYARLDRIHTDFSPRRATVVLPGMSSQSGVSSMFAIA